ncbi:MAG TPA: thiamine pyrophosphate-binding protein [Solirubrobacteraceae bacterium]|jgi:acetolactate synthase-1/2/3 large subunit|nr:thiamine pyrophosphate-binding protein [Solirubrobacteraceae bacterium]
MATAQTPTTAPRDSLATAEHQSSRKRPTLAERQIDLIPALGDASPRAARWSGEIPHDAPACCAFGLISAASVHWFEAAVAHPRVRVVDVSLEAMGAFAAIEASIATGRPQIVICGSGPGTLGVQWAIPAARGQGASLLVLTPRTPPELAGTTQIQESSFFSLPPTVGAELFDANFILTSVLEMPRIAVALRHLFARPQGGVAQLSVPTNLLDRRCPKLLDPSALEIAPPAPGTRALARIAEWLALPGGPPAFILGGGCTGHGRELGNVIKRLGAVHLTTPGALGLLPNSLGLIGTSADADVAALLHVARPRCAFVIGTRLGTASGGNDAALLPKDCPIVHVDAEPSGSVGNAPATRTHRLLSVQSDVGEFVAALNALVVRQ